MHVNADVRPMPRRGASCVRGEGAGQPGGEGTPQALVPFHSPNCSSRATVLHPAEERATYEERAQASRAEMERLNNPQAATVVEGGLTAEEVLYRYSRTIFYKLQPQADCARLRLSKANTAQVDPLVAHVTGRILWRELLRGGAAAWCRGLDAMQTV